MTELKPQQNADREREELLQRFLDKMFSLMKQIHRDIEPHEPWLSPPLARLLFTIARYEDQGISVKDLASIAKITPGAITQHTDALISKNLVLREIDPNDRRMVRLKITPSTKNHMGTIRKNFLTAATQTLGVLNTGDLKKLNSILGKIDLGSQNKDINKGND